MESKNLIIQTAFLGDSLLAIPLIKRLRELDKRSSVHLVCRQGLGELFLKLNLIDRVIEYNKKDKNLYQVLKEIGLHQYNVLLSPHESFTSHRIASYAKAELKIGFKNFWNFLVFNERIKRDMHLPDALRQLSLLTLLDSKLKSHFDSIIQQNFLSMHSKVPTWASMKVDGPLDQSILKRFELERLKKIALIAPGSQWNTKRWTETEFNKLAKALIKKDYKVVFLGSSDEKKVVQAIDHDLTGTKDLTGHTTLYEIYHIMKHSSLLISNDSGLMHMSSVAGLKCISIFGPTTLGLGYRPWQDQAVVIENENLSCRPCGKHGHKVCPIGTHECMKSIPYQSVLGAVDMLEASSTDLKTL